MNWAPDAEFIRWVRERVVNVYKESPNTDWVQRLAAIEFRLRKLDESGNDYGVY